MNQLMLTVALELDDSRLFLESPHRAQLREALAQTELIHDAEHVRVSYHEVPDVTPRVIRAVPMGPLLAPLEYELYFAADGRHMTVRFRVQLDVYEGVTALQLCFNVLEFLEHGRVDAMTRLPEGLPYRYGAYNVARALVLAFTNLGAVVFGVLVAPLVALLRVLGLARLEPDQIWPPGAWAAMRIYARGEHGTCLAYDVPTSVGYHDIIHRMFALAADLGLGGLTATVNYHPRIAIAWPRSPAALLDRVRRRASIVMPSGPPPMPNPIMALLLGNSVVINNYGSFRPNSRASFTSADWDWIALQGWVHAAFIVTINGRCRLLMRVPSSKAARIEALLAKFGAPCETFPPVNADPQWRARMSGYEPNC